MTISGLEIYLSSSTSASSSIKGASGTGYCRTIGAGPIGRPGFTVTIGVAPCLVIATFGSRDLMASAILLRMRSCNGSSENSWTSDCSCGFNIGSGVRFNILGTRESSDLDTAGWTGKGIEAEARGTMGSARTTEATLVASLLEVVLKFGSGYC